MTDILALRPQNSPNPNESSFLDDDDYILNGSRRRLTTAAEEYFQQCSSLKSTLQTLASFFPILQWLPKYEVHENLLYDVLAGLTVAILHVPQGISYALLSRVSPVNGLYASFFAPLFYLLFATSKHVSLGSFAVVALMAGAANDRIMREKFPDIDPSNAEYRSAIAATLTFTIGLCQIAVAGFRLKFMAVYFSDALVGGFTTGAALHVLVSQLPLVLGVKVSASGPGFLIQMLHGLVSQLDVVNWFTFFVTIVSIGFLISGKYVLDTWIHRILPRRIPVPFELILIIATTFLCFSFAWPQHFDVQIVGPVPRGFPTPAPPWFRLIPICLKDALAITVVTVALHISITKMFAKQFEYKVDPGQEIYAIGFTSLLSGFFPTYPTSAGLSRTLVAIENGCRSQLAGVITCLSLLAVILFIGPYFEFLPLCVLSSVIIVALRPMFRKFKELNQLWLIAKFDFCVWLVAFVATVLVDVISGLAIAFVFVLLTVVMRTQWPTWSARVSHRTNSELGAAYCVFRFDSLLLFTNCEVFKTAALTAMNEFLDRHFFILPNISKQAKFIFDCSAIAEIDSCGLETMQEVLTKIRDVHGFHVLFANVNYNLTETLLTSNLDLMQGDFHMTVECAILAPINNSC